MQTTTEAVIRPASKGASVPSFPLLEEGCSDMETVMHPEVPSLGDVVRAVRGAVERQQQRCYTPLDLETRSAVDTACAAHHLSRQPQTLRGWACKEDGPLRPIRVHGRLAWPTSELRRVLGVA